MFGYQQLQSTLTFSYLLAVEITGLSIYTYFGWRSDPEDPEDWCNDDLHREDGTFKVDFLFDKYEIIRKGDEKAVWPDELGIGAPDVHASAAVVGGRPGQSSSAPVQNTMAQPSEIQRGLLAADWLTRTT